MTSFNTRFGLVLTMDVLGARADSIERSLSFAEKIENFKKQHELGRAGVEEKYEEVREMINTRIRGDTPDGRAAQEKMHSLFAPMFQPHIAKNSYFLGDTFIFTFDPEHQDKSRAGEFLIELCNTCTGTFTAALHAGLLVRGAITIGEYIVTNDGRTMLGPAISDAITWCERADWVGMIVTPTTGLHLEETDFEHAYIKQNVRLSKGGGLASVWCLPWPYGYCMVAATKLNNPTMVIKNCRKLLVQKFRENQTIIPAGVESKFNNTMSYFDTSTGTPAFHRKLEEAYQNWQYGIQKGFLKT